MKTITVKTGFGYFRDGSGHIVSKAQLPAGDHPMQEDFTYTELANQVSLDALEIWQDPAEIIKQDYEKKIAGKVRADAVSALIGTGELPPGYK